MMAEERRTHELTVQQGTFLQPLEADDQSLPFREQLVDQETSSLNFFTQAKTSNVTELIDVSKDIASAPRVLIYPNNIDCRKIQKCIVNFNHTVWRNGPNGKKSQYALWMAYSLFFHYNKRTIHDRVPFVLMVPYNAFVNMFARSANISFPRLLQTLLEEHGEIPLLEIHFKKESQNIYELKYLASTEYVTTTKDKHIWQRTKMFYEEKGYVHKHMEIVQP